VPSIKVKDEITPSYLRCSYGGCPAVFSLDNGNLLIIGSKPDPELLKQIKNRVAEGEQAVMLSPEFFDQLRK
jgi:hypothetical protein